MGIDKKFWENESNEIKRHEENKKFTRESLIAAGRCPECGKLDVVPDDPPKIAIESARLTGTSCKNNFMKCLKCNHKYSTDS